MEINIENIKTVNLKKLTLDKKFGDLNFEKSLDNLQKLKKMFVEFEGLGYQNELSSNEQAQINSARNQYIEYLKRILQFDLSQPNPRETRDNAENEIENFYNTTVSSLRNNLTYLRQESILKSQDQKELQKERERIAQTRQKLQETLTKLQKDLEKQKRRRKKIEETKGEVAVNVLAKHFAKQSNDYSEEGQRWLNDRKKLFTALLLLTITNLIAFLILHATSLFIKTTVSATDFFSIQYGVINLSLFSLLFYGLRFTSQNYNIFSNLEAVTRHRKNVALTIEDFLGTNPDTDTRNEMIKRGTEAMFKHLPTGYIPKSESKQTNPLIEGFNFFFRRGADQ